MSAFLGALSSIASQYGEAKNQATEEKFARDEKLKQMDVQQAYLQIAKQADERAQQEHEQALRTGDLMRIGNRLWSVSQAKFVDMKQPDPMEHVRTLMSTMSPKVRARVEPQLPLMAEEYVNDPQGLIRSVLAQTSEVQRQIESESAADERARLSRVAMDLRAQKSREAADERQRRGFGEREKLNAGVMKSHSEAMDADARVTRMTTDITNAEAAEKDPDHHPDGSGAFDMDMLSQHVALTFGAIKGGMRSKAMIDEHRNAVALLERVKRAVSSGVRGSQLSSEQRRNFLILGQEAQAAAWDKYRALKQDVGGGAGAGADGSPAEGMLPGEEVEP